jgi:ribosomal protein L14
MVQDRSLVSIADNSGATIGRVFKVLGSSKKRYAEIGDIVVLSVQKAQPRKACSYSYKGRKRQDGASCRPYLRPYPSRARRIGLPEDRISCA